MPKSGAWNELEAVRLLDVVFRRAGSKKGVALAIGDDAAVLKRSRTQLVWTVDVAVEGVHFDRRFLSLEDVGYRAFNAAASDLAAMGAEPRGALSSLVLPRGFGREELAALARGQADAAKRLDCPVIGGNLARGSEISITTTVLGEARRPLLREGARTGDELWLIGEVGLAAAGLRVLASGRKRVSKSARRCIDAWCRPRARLSEGLKLVGRARAAIDVSDGLGWDAARIARSSAVRVIVSADAVERSLTPELVQTARELGASALDLALSGGEDYALLAAGPSAKRPPFAHVIGYFEAGSGAKLELSNHRRIVLPTGFDHLATPRRPRN